MNRLFRFIYWGKKEPQKLFALCFGAVATGILLSVIITTAINVVGHTTGLFQQKELNIHDFEHVGVEIVDDMTMINETNDTQLIYTGNIQNMYIKCNFSLDPGEFIAFYTRGTDYSFGVHQMVYARQEEDYYVFRFPLGTRQVRIDTGVEPSITIDFEEITLNKYTFKEITGIGTQHIFYIMVLPMFVFAVLHTLIIGLEPVISRKKQNNSIKV